MTSSRAVLFDFDGTLADSAPDLCAALNKLRLSKGFHSLKVEDVRPFASMGARGMVRVGFGSKPGDPDYEPLRDAFLDLYAKEVCADTRLFPGIRELLVLLREESIRWGIVTNKAMRFTEPLVSALSLEPDCVVGGDSTPHLKPHPASLLLAADKLGLSPQACFYLGDDLRDIQAARAAGMRAVAVAWGYLNPDNGGPETWNADLRIDRPLDLVPHL